MAKLVLVILILSLWLSGANSAMATDVRASARGLAVDPNNGDVYVTDIHSRVLKFDNTGRFLLQWGRLGNGEGEFDQPSAIAVDSSGFVYVADRGNGRIQKFDTQGRFLDKWAGDESKNGVFHSVTGIAVDNEGMVYAVVDGSRLVQFDKDGLLLKEVNVPSAIGIAVSQQGVVQAVGDNFSQISNFDTQNPLVTFYPKLQQPPMYGVAIDSKGAMFVTIPSSGAIYKSENNNSTLRAWYIPSNPTDYMPYGIAIDKADNLYVADGINGIVTKYSSEGEVIGNWYLDTKNYMRPNMPTQPDMLPTRSVITEPLTTESVMENMLRLFMIALLPMLIIFATVRKGLHKTQTVKLIESAPIKALDYPVYQQAVSLAQAGHKSDAYAQFKLLETRNPLNVDIAVWTAFTTPNIAQAEIAVNRATTIAPHHESVLQAQRWLENERGSKWPTIN